MIYLYDIFIYQPLLNALIFLYETVAFRDFGIAIILFTIIVRIILFPLFQRSVRHQTTMQHLQPKLKKIEEAHKHDKERQLHETMALYKAHEINPFAGFLFLLIQLPILIALFHILRNLSEGNILGLYSFVPPPGGLNYSFLGLINLRNENIVVVILAALAQYFQGKLGLPVREGKRELSQAERMNRQMVFIGPVMTIIFFHYLHFPAAIALYWLISSIFSIAQQIIINRQLRDGKLGNIREDTN